MPKIVKSGVVYAGGSTLPASNVSVATSGTRIKSTTVQTALKELTTTANGSLTLANTSSGSITYANSHEMVVLSLVNVKLKAALAAGASVSISTLGTTIRPKIETSTVVFTTGMCGMYVEETESSATIVPSKGVINLKLSCTAAGALTLTNISTYAVATDALINGQLVFVKV